MNRLLFQLLILFCFQISNTPINGQNYQRIVSLAPSLTMNLYYLESQDRLIGCTSYCEIAKPDNKPVVASAIKANIEKVVSLKPDLVLVSSITSKETIDMLRKFDIRVEVFYTPKSFQEICDQFLRLGNLVGKSTLADEIISTANDKVYQLQNECRWVDPPKIFIQIGAKPLFAVIRNTFMDDYIQFVNGNNIAFDLTIGTITRESVIARNPDVIFIVTMGILGDEEKENWNSISSITASRTDQIYIIDSNMACTPTPVSFVKTLETIIALICISDQ
ncbi:MAG: helical backbone metal receptor [Bacteroidales bacterium]|nr:helical backbone metal receptor [Bacteroidales bacterium]